MVTPRRRGARNLPLTYSKDACVSNFRAPKIEGLGNSSNLLELSQLQVGLFSGKRWIASFSPIAVFALLRSQHRQATACGD